MLLLHVGSSRSCFIVFGTVPVCVDMMGTWEILKKRIKDETSKSLMLAGLKPTRITPIDFESNALTARPQHLFVRFH